jgi:hypothetical protein
MRILDERRVEIECACDASNIHAIAAAYDYAS